MKEKKQRSISFTRSEWKGKEVTHRLDRINIKLKANLAKPDEKEIRKKAEEIVSQVKGAEIIRLSTKTAKLLLKVPKEADIVKLAEELSKHPEVVYAEPDLVANVLLVPNDLKYVQQWAWPKIKAEHAWDFEAGNSNVLIGIIDTGISMQGNALNHPDLNDASRYILGTDFVNGDAFPLDDFGHGTHVAGTAGAETNNAGGVAGMNWKSPVYVCKVFDDLGFGSESDFESAAEEIVDYAIANNLKAVINLSAGWSGDNQTLRDACKYINDHGMILCVAAGNEYRDPLRSPARHALSFPGVIAVGATDNSDNVADFSNSGPELTVVAPGKDILSTFPTYDVNGGTEHDYKSWEGTSMAAPHVTGLASLIWCRVKQLTNDQVRDVIVNTAVKLGPGNFDDTWGHGRINAGDALAKAGWELTPVQIHLNFIDIPEGETQLRAIKIDVKSFHTTTLRVITGPAAPFTMQGGVTAAVLPKTTDYDTPREAYIWVRYTGTNAGDMAAGTAQVKCFETGEVFNITITANTIARPTCAMMLVLDRSGSMTLPSGVGSTTREEILKFSANIFASVVREKNGVGIVTFDQNAQNLLHPVQGPFGAPDDPFDTARTHTINALTSYAVNPSGSTSIGDGIEKGYNNLTGVSGYDKKAIIVFTDGEENTAKYISDVSSMINNDVFAVGLGTAQQLNAGALTSICNGHRGYMMLTDQLDNDDIYKLAKYFLQIQAGVNNEQIVVDPNGYVAPGSIVKVPFSLNEADISVDAMVMLPFQGIVEVGIETPEGDIIQDANIASFPTVKKVDGKYITYYRMTLPVSNGGKINAQSGQWNLLLKIDSKHAKKYLSAFDHTKYLYNDTMAHGIKYTALVHAYSNLRMNATLSQNSNEPGAGFTVRCVFTEYGVPLAGNTSVTSSLKFPDGSVTTLTLHKTETGVYECKLIASQPGIYTFTIHADGFTTRNVRFTREQVLTGATWKGGDQPVRSATNDPNRNPTQEAFCSLLHCLDGHISDNVKEKWIKEGFNIEAFSKCSCSKK